MTGIPAGYVTDPGFDPAEDHVGPFYYRKTEAGYQCAFIAGDRNCNVNGTVHGGILMTFADFSLCLAASDHYLSESAITVSFNADFVAAAESGSLIECTPRIVRKTGSMAFVDGDLRVGDEIVLTFSAVVKRLREK